MTIKAIAAYQPTRPVPDKQDLVRMQQQPTQAVNELLSRVGDIETPEPWHVVGVGGEPAFENSWTNYASTYNDCAFRKTSDGRVHLRGMVANGSAVNAVVFTLPIGYRPLRRCIMAGASSGGTPAEVLVRDNGEVFFTAGGSTTWSSFDGVSFWMD